MQDLKKIRTTLHQNPELSGNEVKTSEFIFNYLNELNPDSIGKDICGNGIIATFDSNKPGPTVMFRAELDALPIEENSNLQHSSKSKGVSHTCGHDGHMTILLGLANKLKKIDFSGKVCLLFQPAEEVAKGAKCIVESKQFNQTNPNYIFALHNLPGFEKGQIILKKGTFASSSKGLIINLKGKTSHAGHPEHGNSPVFAMIEIINELTKLPERLDSLDRSSLVTIIHVKLGEVAFGTSPGKAQIMATFRSTNDQKINLMSDRAIDIIKLISEKHKLKYKTEWVEIFPALINNDLCVDIIAKAAKSIGLQIKFVDTPFSWTEDFSYYTQKFKGAFFGIGAGLNHPQLHNNDYDFPDILIEDGINIFLEIIKKTTLECR